MDIFTVVLVFIPRHQFDLRLIPFVYARYFKTVGILVTRVKIGWKTLWNNPFITWSRFLQIWMTFLSVKPTRCKLHVVKRVQWLLQYKNKNCSRACFDNKNLVKVYYRKTITFWWHEIDLPHRPNIKGIDGIWFFPNCVCSLKYMCELFIGIL